MSKKPTIQELEEILASDNPGRVSINPDGSICVIDENTAPLPIDGAIEALDDLMRSYKALRRSAGFDQNDESDSLDAAEAALSALRAYRPAPEGAGAGVREALKPFADRLGELEQEAHEALQVGGYVPLDDDNSVLIPVPWLRKARAALEG